MSSASLLANAPFTQTKLVEPVRFDSFEFDCQNGELRRNGTSLKLQPQPAKILAALIGRAGELVTRQDLAQQVWGSETFVDFEQGLNFAIRQIRIVLEDDADRPRFVKTVPKRGYRFIAAVASPPGRKVKVDTPPTQTSRFAALGVRIGSFHMAGILVALAAIVALIAIAFGVKYRAEKLKGEAAASEIKSIAVLPLANLSSDPGPETFSNGLTDELITESARTGTLRVISRTEVQTRAIRRPRFPRCECSSRSTPWLLVRRRSMSAKTPGNTAAGDDETLGPVKLSS